MKKEQTPQARYRAKNTRQFSFECVKTTEQDIIDKMESVPNKQGYVKGLIRQDIEQEKKG